MHTYKVVAYYTKKGRHSPAFPTIPGWTFAGLNKATPEYEKEATYLGEELGLATVVEGLHTFLQHATEKGEVQPGFFVKVFQHVEGDDVPAPAKKKGWLSSFF